MGKIEKERETKEKWEGNEETVTLLGRNSGFSNDETPDSTWFHPKTVYELHVIKKNGESYVEEKSFPITF